MIADDVMAAEELRLERDVAEERWVHWRSSVLHNGGVRLAGGEREDYRDLPVCLRRTSGLPIDTMAAQFDFTYADDFVRAVTSAYDAYLRARDVSLPRIVRHWDMPELQDLLDFYYSVSHVVRRAGGIKRNRDNDELVSVRAVKLAARIEYKTACRAHDVEPAGI